MSPARSVVAASAIESSAPCSPRGITRPTVQSFSGIAIQVKYFESAEAHRTGPFSTFPLAMSLKEFRSISPLGLKVAMPWKV